MNIFRKEYLFSTDEKVYLGIDPGKKGGICFIKNGSFNAIKMPEKDIDIVNFIYKIGISNIKFCFIESVSGYIGNKHPGSRMFTLGQNYGFLLGVLTTFNIPYKSIKPFVWQKGIGISSRKKIIDNKTKKIDFIETKTEFKNRLKDKAIEIFDNRKITLSTCDSILIACYCTMIKR